MLKKRVMTALALLVLLLALLYSDSFPAILIAIGIFCGVASWESCRLFGIKLPILGALMWTALFGYFVYKDVYSNGVILFCLCTAIWVFRLAPSLAIGLPALDGYGNRLLNGIYGIAILGCFVAMLALFKHSALYLFSVMAIVWIADIGAYFFGKGFGKRKIAPSISPGKSWEGAIGGWFSVLLLTGLSTLLPVLSDTFAMKLRLNWGWQGFIPAMSLLVAASIVGDLFESQLKRRAGMKDSSNLLPGHGGVLDRIDALIPVLPLAMLFDFWL